MVSEAFVAVIRQVPADPAVKDVPEVLKVIIPALISQTLELAASIEIVGIAPLLEVASGV